jgi:hypothetical protein
MDLLHSLLDLIQQKSRTKPPVSHRARAAKTSAKSGPLPGKGKGKGHGKGRHEGKGKRELTAAQAVREAELRG